MEGSTTPHAPERPADDDPAAARHEFDELVAWCRTCDDPFAPFEDGLGTRIARLACLLVQLFLTARRQRCDLAAHLADGRSRLGDPAAQRRWRTRFGEARYARAYLIHRRGGAGFHPLDAALGLTRDGFSPWVMSYVARLATRLSYTATTLVCRVSLGWSPSPEVVRHLALGLGRRAAEHRRATPLTDPDGEVLVIEVDGKCTPTATDAELRKRRGPRRRRTCCDCGCQRHRGQAKRRRRGPKPRRKKGDKS
jgi:hypothetical protein